MPGYPCNVAGNCPKHGTNRVVVEDNEITLTCADGWTAIVEFEKFRIAFRSQHYGVALYTDLGDNASASFFFYV